MIESLRTGDMPVHVLSLGAGVQSSTLALMAAHGEVTPMPVEAIFADTNAEPPSVYRWLEWLERQLPFPVIRVSAGSLTDACLTIHANRKNGKNYYSNMIPAFTLGASGNVGKVQRHCTYNYKIVPIRREQKRIAQVGRGEKVVRVIQWIGISWDEMKRAVPSRDVWCQSRWPLIEKRMTRHQCGLWMMEHGYPQPPRSACVYCPFHRNEEWRRLQIEEPEAFAAAVEFEGKLQAVHSSIISSKGKIAGMQFLHRRCKPLATVDFRGDMERGQTCLWQGESCGVCGI